LRRLKDLEGIGHVGRTRHTRQIALDLWIGGQPAVGVLSLLRGGFGQVGDLVAFDDPFAGGNAERRAERDDRALFRWMILDIPIGRIQRLPDAVQVRFAVGGACRLVGLRGNARRSSGEPEARDHKGRSGGKQ